MKTTKKMYPPPLWWMAMQFDTGEMMFIERGGKVYVGLMQEFDTDIEALRAYNQVHVLKWYADKGEAS